MKYLKIISFISLLMHLSLPSCTKENEPEPATIDLEGNSYRIVTIGNQIWMAENLKATIDNQGNPILNISTKEEWGKLESNNVDKAYCYYENDVESKYGLLYTYAAAINVCPTGWHLPSDEEWTELEDYLSINGYDGIEGTALRTRSGWNDYLTEKDGNGTDNYGFSALPGGVRSDNGQFWNGNFMGHWWTSTEESDSTAHDRVLFGLDPEIMHSIGHKNIGQSVRCIKNKE